TATSTTSSIRRESERNSATGKPSMKPPHSSGRSSGSAGTRPPQRPRPTTRPKTKHSPLTANAHFTDETEPDRSGGWCDALSQMRTTFAGDHLRSLARSVADAYIAHTDARAVLLVGSAASGDADYYSDLDLVLYHEQL